MSVPNKIWPEYLKVVGFRPWQLRKLKFVQKKIETKLKYLKHCKTNLWAKKGFFENEPALFALSCPKFWGWIYCRKSRNSRYLPTHTEVSSNPLDVLKWWWIMILSYELCSDFIWSSCQRKLMARDDLLTETQMADLHMTLCSKLKIWYDPGFRVHQRMTPSTWNFMHDWIFLLKVSEYNKESKYS